MKVILSVLKNLLPPTLRKDIHYLRRWRFRTWRDVYSFNILSTLFTFSRLTYRHMTPVVLPLDFQKKRILMDIVAPSQLQRTRACFKEPETASWVENQMKENDVFYDIGANVGAYGLMARALGGNTSRIYAFEAEAANFAALAANIHRNRFGREMIPLNIALGNKREMLSFPALVDAPGYSYALGDSEGVKKAGSTDMASVPLYTLDEFISSFNMPLPTLLKIDVDGMELAVIEGARKVLAHPKLRSILIECDERSSDHPKLLALLTENGFSITESHGRLGSSKVRNTIFSRT